MTHYF